MLISIDEENMKTVKIGLLHSLTGVMAISELPLVDSEVWAIDEINSRGGVLGHKITYTLEDGASNPDTFAKKAEKLITEQNIQVIFGGWNSHVRKSIKQVVERHNSLLWYPIQYEGLEQSDNIIYTGSTLNQQIIPLIEWCLEQNWQKYYLLGSDYIYPIVTNNLIKSILAHNNKDVIQEKYVPLDNTEFSEIVIDLKQNKPEILINTLNGESNVHFFNQLLEGGIRSHDFSLISTSIAEHECKQWGVPITDHYLCWSYFQSLDTPENKALIHRFKKRYGKDRVLSDPIVTAYLQIFMWSQLVESAGSFDVDAIKKISTEQSFKTASGETWIRSNNHVTKKMYIGKSNDKGLFDIIRETDDCLEPLPWLGIEKLDLDSSYLIKEILSKYPDMVNLTNKLEDKINERTQKLKNTLDSTIKTLANLVEIKDPYTVGHQVRVADLSVAIAEELKLNVKTIDMIKKAAIIHDIGKISIPQSILAKPGKLSDIEFSLIKTHTQNSYKILKDIDFGYPVADIVLQHHEKEDGSGYPKGLKGSKIMLEAKIIAVADVIEAMSSHRPYRPAHSMDQALKEIKKGKGKLYKAKVVNACVKIITKKGFKF